MQITEDRTYIGWKFEEPKIAISECLYVFAFQRNLLEPTWNTHRAPRDLKRVICSLLASVAAGHWFTRTRE